MNTKYSQKQMIVAVAVLCIASSAMLTQEAHAQPVGYTETQKANISYDFVFQHTTWADKAYNAAIAHEQQVGMFQNISPVSGCTNGIECMTQLEINAHFSK